MMYRRSAVFYGVLLTVDDEFLGWCKSLVGLYRWAQESCSYKCTCDSTVFNICRSEMEFEGAREELHVRVPMTTGRRTSIEGTA